MKLKVKMNFAQKAIGLLGAVFISIGASLFVWRLCQSTFWEDALESPSLILSLFTYFLLFAIWACLILGFIATLYELLATISGRIASSDSKLYAVKVDFLAKYQPCSVRVRWGGEAEISLTLTEADVASICDQDDRKHRLLFKGVFPLGDTESISLYLTWASVKQVKRLLRYAARCPSLHCHYFQFTFEVELPQTRSSVEEGRYVVLFRWDLPRIARWCASDDGYYIEYQTSTLVISPTEFSQYQTTLQNLPENVGLRIPLAED